MSATRAAALEAVASASRFFREAVSAPLCTMPEGYLQRTRATLDDAFTALDALSSLPAEPEPEGEMVEVRAAVQENENGSFSINGIRWEDGTHGVHVSPLTVAVITAQVRKRVVPEVVAKVVKP